MARVIWAWAIDSDTFLTAAQIPGILNMEKDEESRNSELRTEWKLQESIFKNIQIYFDFYPTSDLFTSTINA